MSSLPLLALARRISRISSRSGRLRAAACLIGLVTVAGHAQTSVPDAAVPVVIAPSLQGTQYFVLNRDRSILAASTVFPSSYSLQCSPAAGITDSATAATPFVFNDRTRFLFEAGLGAGGTNAVVADGANFSGTNRCSATPAVTFYGTSATLTAVDPAHSRLLVLSSNGSGTPDVATNFSTSNTGDYTQAGTISKLSQASLDSGGRYSSISTDVNGTVGYSAITQMRTDASAGGLWIFDPSFGRTVKILGPGGVALPAVASFVIPNPKSVGGNLLVLINQDNLTSANLASPPAVSSPITILDMGQVGTLLQNSPTAASITLPFSSTIASSLSYYAIFGGAFNPVDNKVYVLVGGGTSASNIVRQVIRYDPYNPAAPAETVIAQLGSAPLDFGTVPQITLNAAAGTLQILTSNPAAVYSVSLLGGATAAPLAGATFGDASFQPTYIATNSLLGETYIASASQVDVLTLPAGASPRGLLQMDPPLSTPSPNVSTSVRMLANFPLRESTLSSSPVTVTATAQSTGTSFTFATTTVGSLLDLPRFISGTFPATDVYTLVASFAGDSTYPAVSSTPVIVGVGKPIYTTQVSATATASSATAATATVTLSGSTYSPTGKITVLDATGTNTLATYTLSTGALQIPISIPFTIPSGTTSIVVKYAGDSLNSSSQSAAVTISQPIVKTDTTISLTAPTNVTPNTSFTSLVSLVSINGTAPTGQVILYASKPGSSNIQIGAASATSALGAGAQIAASLSAGTYTLYASYAGDANLNGSTSNNVTLVVATSTTPAVSLSATSLTFSTALGTTSALQNVVLTNSGGGALSISSIAASGAGFTQVNGCPSSLAAGDNCTIRVSYTPASAGTVAGAVTITDNATGSPHKITLTGTSSGPVASVSPASPSFGSLTVGTSSINPTTVFLQNTGTGTLTVSSVKLSNINDFEYSLPSNGCKTGTALPAGAACVVLVEFHPTSAGNKTTTLQFVTSDTVSTQAASISGNGLAVGQCTDIDGDALCDDWENFGVNVRVNGVDHFIDLPSMGADSRHKDVFIQADWMAQDPSVRGAHTHKPLVPAMAIVVQAFGDSPVTNPDGKTGIHMHVDCGAECVMDPVSNATWGTMSIAKSLPETAVFDAVNTDPNKFSWTLFDLLSADFVNSGRPFIFHHVIFGHDQQNGNSSSGKSRNSADLTKFFQGASDFVVTLGSAPGNPQGTVFQQAGTMMHEFGHNLGLAHGGQDGNNNKPNYLSIMNYSFQFTGLIVNNNGVSFANGLFDYSRFTLPDFVENKLNEQMGIGADPKTFTGVSAAFPAIDHYGTMWFCPGAKGPGALIFGAQIDGTINWDCDTKRVISPRVQVDADGDGGIFLLSSYADWPKLVFTGGAVGGNGAAIGALATTTSDEFQVDQENTVVAPFLVKISGMGIVRSAPGRTIGLRFTLLNAGATADTYSLTSSSALGWVNATVTPSTLTLAPGASAEVGVNYTIPVGTADGVSDTLALTAKSQTSDRIFDVAQTVALSTATPAPLSFSAASIVFASQALNGVATPMPLTLTNTGTAALTLASLTASAQFSQTNNCGATLAVGASCTVSVAFTPSAVGTQTGTLTIVDSGSAQPEVVTLRALAVAAQPARPSIAMTVSPTGTITGQTVTLTATVSGAPVTTAPTGTVTFFNESVQLGQALVNGAGVATFSSSSLSAGTYNVYAVYSGDATFLPVAAPFQTLTITQAVATAVTLSSSAATAAPGATVTLTASVSGGTGTSQPTGAVRFMEGSTLLGTGTLNASAQATFSTTALALGVHTIAAVYAGDAVFGGSTSAAFTETIATVSTTTTLAVSSASPNIGAAVTLTATVAGSSGTPTGSVSFLDGTTTVGTAVLNASGVGTFTTTALALGAHSITAQYGGAGIFTASASAAKVITVIPPPDFTVTANPTSLTITHGSTGTTTFTVTPANGYAGTVTLTCGTLPTNASCKFAATQLVFTSATQTPQSATLTIDTTLHTTAVLRPLMENGAYTSLAAILGLPCFTLSILGLRRRLGRKGLGSVKLLVLLAATLGVAALGGCGGSSPQTTPAGSYTVSVTATDGSNTHASTFTLVVN